jgi:hypothetical protein
VHLVFPRFQPFLSKLATKANDDARKLESDGQPVFY